ncbi:MAG: hypothetical protein HY216_14795 [Candidatus Rokubacteria bacterium]|nr:hypothetical protein [Candidatus Rokubacteria bacterium]
MKVGCLARAGALEVHRTSGESLRAEIGYSEVFFESWFASGPAAAALIARQVEARVVPA